MIESITVTNYLGESMTIELRNPELSGFLITDIPGLSPGKGTISTTELLGIDGATFNMAKIGVKNIVLAMKLLPFPTIQATRRLSYKYFPVKTKVDLRIVTDDRVYLTSGYVESNEASIFSKQETVRVSIICESPYLKSENIATTLFSGIVDQFEFPFSNESLTSNLLVMGDLVTLTENNVYYDGDEPTGFVIRIHAIGSASEIKITNRATGQLLHIMSDRIVALTGSDIIAGDDIVISTVSGGKYVKLYRDGGEINLINCLYKTKDKWLRLVKGDNILVYTADVGPTNLYFSIENDVLYAGA